MISTVEYVELRTAIPGDLGYECTFYYGIRWRTAHLRERLYVVVEVKGHEFRPRAGEHFPADEHLAFQGVMPGIGAGGPVEVLFRCYAPPGSSGAEEGVRAIAAALEELADRVGLGHWSRSMAVALDNRRYAALVGLGSLPSYRPPPAALPARKPPMPETVPPIGAEATRQFRGHLERWGVLEDYDRMRAASSRPGPRPRSRQGPEPFTPWTPPPEPEGLKRWREFQERQKAMQETYERMGGSWS